MVGESWILVYCLASKKSETFCQLSGAPCTVVAGSCRRLALLLRPSAADLDSDSLELKLYKTADSGALALVISLTLQPGLAYNEDSPVAVSPEGALLAVHAWPTSAHADHALIIADFDGHLVQQVPLSWAPDKLEWALDGATLLCSGFSGQRVLLAFA